MTGPRATMLPQPARVGAVAVVVQGRRPATTAPSAADEHGETSQTLRWHSLIEHAVSEFSLLGVLSAPFQVTYC